jgi:hypothetical protein
MQRTGIPGGMADWLKTHDGHVENAILALHGLFDQRDVTNGT